MAKKKQPKLKMAGYWTPEWFSAIPALSKSRRVDELYEMAEVGLILRCPTTNEERKVLILTSFDGIHFFGFDCHTELFISGIMERPLFQAPRYEV